MVESIYLSDYLASNYNLKLKKYSLIPHSNIDSKNFLIDTNDGYFVLKKFSNIHPTKKIERVCEVLSYLIKNNIPVVEPIKNSKKRFVDKNNRYFLTKFYSGKLSKGKMSELKNTSKSIAQMHNILKKCPIKYNFNTQRNQFKILTINELKNIFYSLKNKKTFDTYDNLLIKNKIFIEKQLKHQEKVFKSLPIINKQLIHNDLHPSNILFSGDKVKVILDFNSLKKGFFIEDLCFGAFRFAFLSYKNSNDLTSKINVFCETYFKNSNLNYDSSVNISYYLNQTILERISFILREKYSANSNSWLPDLPKFLNYLKIINKCSF